MLGLRKRPLTKKLWKQSWNKLEQSPDKNHRFGWLKNQSQISNFGKECRLVFLLRCGERECMNFWKNWWQLFFPEFAISGAWPSPGFAGEGNNQIDRPDKKF